MSTLFQDFRYALRQLLKSPGFTLTAVLSLTLGIGATTAVFSIVHAVLMNPYPYAAPDRMVHLRLRDKSGREIGFGLTGPQYQAMRQSPVVESAFMEEDWNLTVTGHDLPQDVNGVYLSSNSFEHLGVPTALGRGLISADAVDGEDPQPVVVLGYKFWQRHFDADPKVLGQTLQLVRKNYTIVGVAGQRFTWGDADVYLPLKVTQDPTRSDYVGLRLKPGVTHQTAVAALTPMILQFAKDTPKHFPTDHFEFVLVGLNEDFVKQIGGALYLLFGAVAFLLLIGCSNVSILLMARGTSRQHELAVRMAIGATRGRVIRQLLTEALILSLTGAALGVLLAYKLLAVIVSLLPQYSFPHEAAIQINLPVLFFSVAVALLTGVLFGLWPALQLSRPDVGQVMQAGTRKIAGSISGKATNNLLIGGQIALTLVMLAAAGAAIQGFLKLMHTSLGYDPHNVMSVGIPVHDGTYKTWASRSAYFDQLRARVSAVPGVKMTAISSNATPPSNGFPTGVEFLGKPAQDGQKVLINVVSPSYFPLLRVPKIQGRIWDETEDRNGARVTVINETMARLYFPKGDAVGHSMRVPALKDEPPYTLMAPGGDDWLQIVGIVGDKKDDGLMKPVAPEAFVPSTLTMRMYTQILVRSDVSPLTLLHTIGAQISAVDADQQMVANVQDLDHWISGEQYWQQQRLVAWLFGAFAVLALSLAAVGLYSVVSYTVAQRTSEFGIRMALGAQREHVLRIVFQSTATSVAGGIAVGLALTIALQRVLAHWSEGSSRDPLILVGVLVVLGAVALVACAVPARRASMVDPVTALRN